MRDLEPRHILSNHQSDPLGKFNTLQDLELRKIKATKYDRMDGRRVYSDLNRNRHLWNAARLVSYVHDNQVQGLRALELHAGVEDTLLISTSRPHKEALDALASCWRADAILWLPEEQTIDANPLPGQFEVVSVRWWADGLGARHENGKHALKFETGGRR